MVLQQNMLNNEIISQGKYDKHKIKPLPLKQAYLLYKQFAL